MKPGDPGDWWEFSVPIDLSEGSRVNAFSGEKRTGVEHPKEAPHQVPLIPPLNPKL